MYLQKVVYKFMPRRKFKVTLICVDSMYFEAHISNAEELYYIIVRLSFSVCSQLIAPDN